MRYLWLASVVVVFAFAGSPRAWAFEQQINNDTNADGSARYTDADDALEDSVAGGRGMSTYQFEMPRFGSTKTDAGDGTGSWDAQRKRLVFGPFDDNVYGPAPQ